MILIEEIPLEGILEGTPPCEAYVSLGSWLDFCGRPSVVRILFDCSCGQWRGFICSECLRCYISGEYICNKCRMSCASLSEC